MRPHVCMSRQHANKASLPLPQDEALPATHEQTHEKDEALPAAQEFDLHCGKPGSGPCRPATEKQQWKAPVSMTLVLAFVLGLVLARACDWVRAARNPEVGVIYRERS